MAINPFVPDFNPNRQLSADDTKGKKLQEELSRIASNPKDKLSLPFPFSGILAIEVDGSEPIIKTSFPGQSDFSASCPMNVLSTGKMFTTAAILQLVEEEKLSLDTPLSDLLTEDELDLPLEEPYKSDKPLNFQELRKHYSKITVRHLLTHTAGFTRRDESKGLPRGEQWQSEKDIGKRCYSNYGFQLLARIIGKHSSCGDISDHEKGFRKHIEKRIFQPAGMKGAIQELREPFGGATPELFSVEEGKVTKDDSTPPYPHGNGCWTMPVSDLLLFGKAIRDESLLSRQAMETILKSAPPLGFMVEEDETGRVSGFGHPGAGPGCSSFLHIWLTDPPITAALLSNYSGTSNIKPVLDKEIPKLLKA